MIKTKDNQIVVELKEVFDEVMKEVTQDGTISKKLLVELQLKMDHLISDYNATRNSLNDCNSLVVKYEKYFEVIGKIEKASILDTTILDETIEKLSTIRTIQ